MPIGEPRPQNAGSEFLERQAKATIRLGRRWLAEFGIGLRAAMIGRSGGIKVVLYLSMGPLQNSALEKSRRFSQSRDLKEREIGEMKWET